LVRGDLRKGSGKYEVKEGILGGHLHLLGKKNGSNVLGLVGQGGVM